MCCYQGCKSIVSSLSAVAIALLSFLNIADTATDTIASVLSPLPIAIVFCATQNSDFKLFRDFSLHEYNTVGFPLESTSSGHFKHWFKGFPWVSAGPRYFKNVGQM